MIRALWYRLFGDPTPILEYCDVCHKYDSLPGSHLCFGPLLCEGCDVEILLEDPLPTIGSHISCSIWGKEDKS